MAYIKRIKLPNNETSYQIFDEGAQRVILHKTASEWTASNYTPAIGEMVIYDIDSNYNYERFKIGNGTSTVEELPFTTNIHIQDTPPIGATFGALWIDTSEIGETVFKYLNANGQWEIIGNSGGSKDAVQYIPQELTDAQKAQARDNIGAEDAEGVSIIVEDALDDLTKYVAVDEESDGYVEIKDFVIETDTIQIDKTLSIPGAAADAAAVREALENTTLKWINW